MARRKSHETDKEKSKDRTGPPSYPYVVYASWTPPGGELRWLILKFQTAWGARNMIHALTKNLFGGSYELKRISSLNWHYMQFENGMKVSLRDDKQYQEVMELDFDESEAFVSPDVQRFKYGSSFESRETAGSASPPDERAADRSPKKSHRSKADRAGDAGPKERKPKIDKTGLVSANQIADELGVPGREVRGVLRSLKLQKPQGGWAWAPDEAEDIKAKIKAGLKGKKK